MKRQATLHVLAMLVFTALLWPQPAAAQWPQLNTAPTLEKTGGEDVAVVVAIEDYVFLPNIAGAKKNANAWELFFARGLGVSEVHVLTDQDATREEILAFTAKAANQVGDNGTLWFIFIGHGAPAIKSKEGLLLGMDVQQTVRSLEARGLSRDELLRALAKGKQSQTVVVLDACFSGRSGSGSSLFPGVQPVVPVIKSAAVPENAVVLSAAKANQVAGQLPGANRPAFSYLILGSLRGWSDDGDGEVTAQEALWFTRQQLRGVKGRQQTPELSGAADLVLTKGATELAPGARPRVSHESDADSIVDPDDNGELDKGEECPGEDSSENALRPGCPDTAAKTTSDIPTSDHTVNGRNSGPGPPREVEAIAGSSKTSTGWISVAAGGSLIAGSIGLFFWSDSLHSQAQADFLSSDLSGSQIEQADAEIFALDTAAVTSAVIGVAALGYGGYLLWPGEDASAPDQQTVQLEVIPTPGSLKIGLSARF